ncbi:PID-CTERM protein-sorting domain-containing protein [Hymenobacter latericus]|uniref:PID-CTERM protein-sorting domain-containing protein n=1 Tax=Hymenobacter sp. YIM 151858-1 TaxID=2987688 RepID=UPI0022273C30|nr:hypothetical protein [Hymenobacter sp. YIM 151858-1]UYZ61160.1 hypothetical protein OIS50_19515 [Hymenobacter sp. YIM 151858-1]
MKPLVLIAVLLTAGLLRPAGAYAQGPGSGGPAPGPTDPSGPTAIPIDGGASLLAAGAVAYGLRTLRQRRRS